MANVRKGENQKLKMLYLVKILSEETDDPAWLDHASDLRKTGRLWGQCGPEDDLYGS